VPGQPQRTVHDQQYEVTFRPGRVARAEGQPPVSDQAVNQAYDGLGAVYAFYWTVFGRDSLDGRGLPLTAMVHYGVRRSRVFWDKLGHVFCGDGDGRSFIGTTAGLDVIGHELTHGVIRYQTDLVYAWQSGALVESLCDVFGILVKQFAHRQDAAQSDWLLGGEIVGPALQPALRSLRAPGTANARDRQAADMDHYIHGAPAHLNAGIPNRAFYVAATTLGGYAWDAPARIWYGALCDPALPPRATFREFALLTLEHARRLYGTDSREALAVRAGWDAVRLRL
jgi:Zn-dependent metalloprotease